MDGQASRMIRSTTWHLALAARWRFAAALSVALGGGTACGGEGGTTGPAEPVRVDVIPAQGSLTALGATQQFSAKARDAGGAAVTGQTFQWSSYRRRDRQSIHRRGHRRRHRNQRISAVTQGITGKRASS